MNSQRRRVVGQTTHTGNVTTHREGLLSFPVAANVIRVDGCGHIKNLADEENKAILQYSEKLLAIESKYKEKIKRLKNQLRKKPKTVTKEITRERIVFSHRDAIPSAESIPKELQNYDVKEFLFTQPSPCIYFLCKDRVIIRIGETINISKRSYEHIKHFDFDSIFFINAPAHETERRRQQDLLIIKHRPPLNRERFLTKINAQ